MLNNLRILTFAMPHNSESGCSHKPGSLALPIAQAESASFSKEILFSDTLYILYHIQNALSGVFHGLCTVIKQIIPIGNNISAVAPVSGSITPISGSIPPVSGSIPPVLKIIIHMTGAIHKITSLIILRLFTGGEMLRTFSQNSFNLNYKYKKINH